MQPNEPSDDELTRLYIRQVEVALRDMASRVYGGIAFEQTTREIIVHFIDNRTLAPNFLQEYEKLIENPAYQTTLHVFLGFSSLDRDRARDLMKRLDALVYANEKMIHQLSSSFEGLMTQNFDILKQAGVPTEVLGRLATNMQLHIRLYEELSKQEVKKLIEESRKTS